MADSGRDLLLWAGWAWMWAWARPADSAKVGGESLGPGPSESLPWVSYSLMGMCSDRIFFTSESVLPKLSDSAGGKGRVRDWGGSETKGAKCGK